jgi:hypothetical protein
MLQLFVHVITIINGYALYSTIGGEVYYSLRYLYMPMVFERSRKPDKDTSYLPVKPDVDETTITKQSGTKPYVPCLRGLVWSIKNGVKMRVTFASQ